MRFQALNTAPSTHLVDSLDFGLDVVHSRLTVFVHSIQNIQQLWDALMCEGSMQPGRSFTGLLATPFSTDGWINTITYWTSVLTSLARSAPRTRGIRFHGVGFGSTLKEGLLLVKRFAGWDCDSNPGYTRTSPRMRFEFEFGVKEDEILADFETGTVVIGVRFSMLNKRSILLPAEGQFNTYFKLEQLSGSTTVNVAILSPNAETMLPAPQYLARYKFSSIQNWEHTSVVSILRHLWFNLASSRNFCVHQAERSVAFGRLVQFLNIGNGWELLVPRDSTQRRTRIKWNPEFFDLGLRLGAAFAFHLFLFQFSFKLRLPRARIAQAARELQNGDVSADVTAPTRSMNPSSQLETRPCAHKFSSIEAAAMERLSLETTLPLDLERHIFELYAHWRPVSIPKLMLVAWRVKVWVEPILYRTLLVNNDDPIAGCVRNVYLDDVGDTTLELLLSQCTGIENLWIRHDLDNLIPLFARLSLKDLYADIRPLLPALSPSHPFFSQITHLELIGGSVDPSPKEMGIWSGLAHLPRLTHLSFNDDDFIDICSPLLQSCKFLVVLICLEMASVDTEADDRAVEEGLQQDLRFVIMGCRLFRKDWQMGTHAGVDYWTRAEVQFRISEDSSEFIV
ncbi:hypothetical protein C8R43DRAFT_1238861 [Mycena crocata]|nr:hypothetical protein C8R43DRAFT_1238861 [Mycena crocata]